MERVSGKYTKVLLEPNPFSSASQLILRPTMPEDISSQVDIGSLSLRSLGQFSTLLTALSADDIPPTALFQLRELDAALPVSGPLAAQAPDYLQRYNNTRIERLGIIVGWRKGDSASFMAQSAGGQAIALLSAASVISTKAPAQEIFFMQFLRKSYPLLLVPAVPGVWKNSPASWQTNLR